MQFQLRATMQRQRPFLVFQSISPGVRLLCNEGRTRWAWGSPASAAPTRTPQQRTWSCWLNGDSLYTPPRKDGNTAICRSSVHGIAGTTVIHCTLLPGKTEIRPSAGAAVSRMPRYAVFRVHCRSGQTSMNGIRVTAQCSSIVSLTDGDE